MAYPIFELLHDVTRLELLHNIELASFSIVLGLQTCAITCGKRSTFQSLCFHCAFEGPILELNGNSLGRHDLETVLQNQEKKNEDSSWL